MGLRERLEDRERDGAPIRVGVVGAGQMGGALVAQMNHIPGMQVVLVADADQQRAADALSATGVEPVDPAGAAAGRPGAAADAAEVTASPVVDVVVEATGSTNVGARVAYDSILHGKHVIMLNAEADVTVGAILAQMARSAGVVYTGSAGDEPGAILELFDFARTLGFDVLVAGKGKNNPLDQTATAGGLVEEAETKRMSPHMLAAFVDGTKTMVEMAAVANATGFTVDVPGMHGIAEDVPDRLAERLATVEEGGVLSRYGAAEYVRGVAPGVFLVVRPPNEASRATMAYLGMGEGPNHVLYRPFHLTSLETPMSIARAVVYGEPTIVSRVSPSAEVVAVAKRDLAEGDELGGIGSDECYGVVYPVAEAGASLPIGLSAGARVTRDVKRHEVLRRDDVEMAGSFVADLRRLQDRLMG